MACIKPETFLTEEEIKAYLQVLADQPLGDIELSKQIKHPLFKVRSTLRGAGTVRVYRPRGGSIWAD